MWLLLAKQLNSYNTLCHILQVTADSEDEKFRKLIAFLLVTPKSTTDVERGFSALKIVKDFYTKSPEYKLESRYDRRC